MKTKQRPLARVKNWFTGSISRKLTLFVVSVCLLLILLVWLLGVQLLEPAYNASIRTELGLTLDTILAVFDEAEADGVDVVALYAGTGGMGLGLSPEMAARLNSEIDAGTLNIENLCIDMSTPQHGCIFIHDGQPANCTLHSRQGLFDGSAAADSEQLSALRGNVLNGDALFRQNEVQMTMGKATQSGQVAVIISANLERIPQAVGVLRRLMLLVSVALVVISVLAAMTFSRWFSKPLLRLQTATKEMAKGNYDVRVEEKGNDEISDLSKDFNVMAGEVKCSVDLQRDLIANVSHDLRTPLTLIKGYAETVRDITGDDKEKRDKQLNVIVDETDRLSTLVGSVMELSRMSSGNEKPKPVRFNLAQLCEEVAYPYETACENNGCHLEFTGPEDCEIEADPALIERALHNLIGNAMNHVGADGYIGLHIRPAEAGKLRVEVQDHGPGIAPEDIPHLFDRFYRSRADKGRPGTGLGLSITKAIFEAHGFAYGVESRLGEGATFWFEVGAYNC